MPENLMAPGGGLTKSKLLLASASEDDVILGETFYAGAKELKNGSIVDHTGITSNVSIGTDSSSLYIRIPYGAYRLNAGSGYPEIKLNVDDIIAIIASKYRSKMLKKLNLSLQLKVSAYLGTHGSTSYGAGYGTVLLNGSQIMTTGGETQNMNGSPGTWSKTYKIV